MISSADMDLAHAYVRNIQDALAGTCDRFELAGALRRGILEFTETGEMLLEFVVIPTVVNEPVDECGVLRLPKDLLVDAVEGLDEAGECKLQRAFPYREDQLHNLIFPWGIVRLWIAKPDLFGSLLLFRTGPQSHLNFLSALAKEHRLCLLPYNGLLGGSQTFGTTEEEIYTQLGMTFVAPNLRNGEQQCA